MMAYLREDYPDRRSDMSGQFGGYSTAKLHEPGANLCLEAAAREIAGRTGASYGHNLGAIWQDERNGNGVDVWLP